MRAGYGLICLAAMALPAVGVAQDMMCDPCVDYPKWSSPIPASSPQPGTIDLNVPADRTFNLGDPQFYLGASIANLRGLNTASGVRTLTLVESRRSPEEPPGNSGEEASGEEISSGEVGAGDEEPGQAAETIEPSDE